MKNWGEYVNLKNSCQNLLSSSESTLEMFKLYHGCICTLVHCTLAHSLTKACWEGMYATNLKPKTGQSQYHISSPLCCVHKNLKEENHCSPKAQGPWGLGLCL